MQKMSKFVLFLFISISLTLASFYFYFVDNINAQSDVEAFPRIKFPCDDVYDPEFHSLRPYQGAACGDAGKALFCSNALKFIESFDVAGRPGTDCRKNRTTRVFTCHPDLTVDPHNLYVELTDAMFPIMGNTEQVTNSQGGTEEFDDAQKVNEYASWYLSGVANRAEYGVSTDDQIVNYSGPLNKLLPIMIQESERIKTIEKATVDGEPYIDEDTGDTFTEPQNHDQIVVCEDGNKAVPCPQGKELRLSDWGEGNLSTLNWLLNIIPGVDKWNNKFPPLPWQFEKQVDYQKAYSEWQGKICTIVPVFGLVCGDPKIGEIIDVVPNKWADLYNYIPLSSTADKKGAERITDVQFQASQGTAIDSEDYDFENQKSAPLWFAHTQEVKELSELLNKTYIPQDYENEPIPKTTEEIKKEGLLDCSAVNVRTNPGDNLFPGDRAQNDTQEMIIPGVTYRITEAKCSETFIPGTPAGCGPGGLEPCPPTDDLVCNAEVIILVLTDIKVPNADEVFSMAVADSGSTFRKIFPKVEKGAPVECIADIPAVSNVTYNADESEIPNNGTLEFKVDKTPNDSSGDGPELTFPHIGSVYEYFLKGIQTALRPKGYGEPIANGNCKPTDSPVCGELPEGLPKAEGACNLDGVSSRVGDIPESLKDIVSAAAETYKVHPNMILALMYGEGAFNQAPYQKYDWTEENVKNWATCEPLPNCSGPQTSIISGLALNWSSHVDNVFEDLKKVDPTKTKESVDGCNLIDEIYVIASMIRGAAGGGVDLVGKQCYGITMGSYIPQSCGEWDSVRGDSMIETALRVYQLGSYWTPTSTTANVSCPYPGGCNCATLPGSCATGGGIRAGCDKPGDNCEKNGGSGNSSHNACVFDVAKGR